MNSEHDALVLREGEGEALHDFMMCMCMCVCACVRRFYVLSI